MRVETKTASKMTFVHTSNNKRGMFQVERETERERERLADCGCKSTLFITVDDKRLWSAQGGVTNSAHIPPNYKGLRGGVSAASATINMMHLPPETGSE
ncbi:hypothetical protein PAMP_014504 [Pampus punctatissimus]